MICCLATDAVSKRVKTNARETEVGVKQALKVVRE